MSSKNKPLPIYLDRISSALSTQGIVLKRAQLLEVCAAAFGYRNSNELTAAAKAGDLTPPQAEPIGSLGLPGGQRIIILKDPLANAPYAIDESFVEQVVAEERAEQFGVTPYGHIAGLNMATDTAIPNLEIPSSGGSPYAGKITVYNAVIEHKHGEEDYTAATEDDLYGKLSGYVQEWWNEVKDHAKEDEGPESDQTDRELVATYFDICQNHELGEYLRTWSTELEVPVASLSPNGEKIDRAPINGPDLLGYQIADSSGRNIQGDDGCPGDHRSFEILTLARAQQIMAELPAGGRGYLLQPIYRGTIECATIVDVDEKAYLASTREDMLRLAGTLNDGPGSDVWYDAWDFDDQGKINDIEEIQHAMVQAANILKLRAAGDQDAYETQIDALNKKIAVLETEGAELRDILTSYENIGCFDWTKWNKTLKGLKKHSHFSKDPLSDEDLELLRAAVADNHTKDSEADRHDAKRRVSLIAEKKMSALLARLDRAEELLGKGEIMSGPVLSHVKNAWTVEATRDGESVDFAFLCNEGEDPEVEGVMHAAKIFSLDGIHAIYDNSDDAFEEHIEMLRAEMDTCQVTKADIALPLEEAVNALERGEASVLVHTKVQAMARRLGIDPRRIGTSPYHNHQG